MARAPISKEDQTAVLTRSARRCAWCFGLDGSLAEVPGQIAHVDRNNANPALSNLAFLCMEHHDRYDSRTSQSKGLTAEELVHYRDQLHVAIAGGKHHAKTRAEIDPAEDRARVGKMEAHDRAIFERGEQAMGEAWVMGWLDHIAADHSYRSSQVECVLRFIETMDLGANSFLLEPLETPKRALLEALTGLLGFLATNFFVYPSRQGREDDTRYCMYPDLNIDRGGGLGAGDFGRYQAYRAELNATLDAVAEAYRSYRGAVKHVLIV